MTHRALFVVCALVLCGSTAAGSEPQFMGLGYLPGGSIQSEAYGISGDGSTIVGRSDSTSGSEAFYWRESTGLVSLGRGAAIGASYDGSVIVGEAYTDTGDQYFRWTDATGRVFLGPTAGGYEGDVSGDGSVVVYSERTSTYPHYEAVAWTEGTGIVKLGTLPGGDSSRAEAVSGDGSVVVGISTSAFGLEAFHWTQAEGMLGLGDLQTNPEFIISEGMGVSSDGTYIVGGARADSSASEPFRWDSVTGMQSLCPEGIGGFRTAGDVSADGAIVVGPPRRASGGARAFIWDEISGCRLLKDVLENDFGLDLGDWTLVAATAISDDGQVVAGYGNNPSGSSEAWMAVIPVPEPAAGILGISGLASAYVLGRNRRRN